MTSTTQAQAATQISPQQVQAGAQAALEVLEGAQPNRILALTGDLVIAKLVLGGISRGELVVGRPPAEPSAQSAATPASQPQNRKERRAAKHQA